MTRGHSTPKRRLRLMHFTMLMLALLFISKVSVVATATKELLSVRQAQAAGGEEKAEAMEKKTEEMEKKPAMDEKKSMEKEAMKEEGGHGDEAKKDDGHGGGDDKAPKEPMTQGEGKRSLKEIEALKAKEAGPVYTQTELDLLQNLAKRRDDLDAREQELLLKSKVLESAEKRISEKVAEMKALQAELSKVVAQYQQQQSGEILSLVKIYETMKPGDAAAIFNEMEMPILLEVIDKMSERKVAPVLAGMDPKRARDVTQELAEMRRGRASMSAKATSAAAAQN